MITLVDADIVSYRCAASAEGDPVEIALQRCENQMVEILDRVNRGPWAWDSQACKVFLSGEGNFRYEIFPEYKANRTQPKPKWLQECREYLVTCWGAQVTEGYEADDAIGMAAHEMDVEAAQRFDDRGKCLFTIASDDKDLLQIAGNHYNIRTQKHIQVTPDEAIWMFYFQLLVGDSVDNIKGCKGIGKVKAERALGMGMSEYELFEICRNLYNNDEELLMNGQLLYILREEGKIWQYPQQVVTELEQEVESAYMQ